MLRQAEHLPAVVQAIIALDAWNEISVLQHAPWLGRLLAASILRQAGITTGAHLAAINLGLKTIPVDRRRSRDRETRLLAIAQGLIAAAEISMKEHNRLTLAKTMFGENWRGGGRRRSFRSWLSSSWQNRWCRQAWWRKRSRSRRRRRGGSFWNWGRAR